MSADKPTPELYRQLFEEDKRGAAILEHLVRLYASGAQLPTATVPGIDAVLLTYHRQGAHSVIQHILNQINRAHQVPITEEEDESQPLSPAER